MNINPYEPAGPRQDEIRHSEHSDGLDVPSAADGRATAGSPQLSASQRAALGAKEGAVIGLVVALVRSGIKLYRKGPPDDLLAQLPEISAYFAVTIFAPAYLFAVGQAIARGYSGSFVGAATFAVAGGYMGFLYGDRMGVAAYSLVVAAALGFLIGAPAGASTQRGFARRSPTPAIGGADRFGN